MTNVLIVEDEQAIRRFLRTALEGDGMRVFEAETLQPKPLIVTTNLTLDSLQNPLDTAHARIYDRLLEMCAPIPVSYTHLDVYKRQDQACP